MSRKRATSATMATEPAYDIVIRRIERLRIPETTIWLAEYGDTNHTWCATIFANASDRTIVRSIGERIYNRGGMDALQANFYILYHGFIADEEDEEGGEDEEEEKEVEEERGGEEKEEEEEEEDSEEEEEERAQHASRMHEIGMAWNGIGEWCM